VQWGFQGVADAAHGNTTGLVFPNNMTVRGQNRPSTGLEERGIGGTPFAVNLPVGESVGGIALTMGSVLDSFRLDVSLSAMESSGRGKVISTPNVTAQNNREARIESGQRIPVQVLVDNTASVQFINANLQLVVTPQITDEDTIMLDIVVDKSEPDFSREVTGIPTIFTRRAQTRVLVRDGGTTVIGGIFQLTVNEVENRVPALHRIPLLGWLFKSENETQSNNELLIFITPQILEQ
jgi:type IV pilus assembly protein PilQ